MERKFKIGDYVEVNTCIPLCVKIGQIVDIEDGDYLVDDCLVQEKYIKLWKPTDGELCIFFDECVPMFIGAFKYLKCHLNYGIDSLGTLKYAQFCKPFYSNLIYVEEKFNGKI